MHIGIIGPGALGSLFAVRLQKSGQRVTVIHRNSKILGQIRQNGIILVNSSRQREYAKVATSRTVSHLRVDFFLLMVKAYDTMPAAKSLQIKSIPTIPVLTLQNGLGNVETLTKLLGRERVLAGSTTEASFLIKPGHARSTGKGLTQIGEPNGEPTQRVRDIVRVFNTAGLQSRLTRNIMGTIWSKAILNSAINPITAITGLSNGQMLERQDLCDLAKEIIREGNNVSIRASINLASPAPEKLLLSILRATKENSSSMLQDVRNGKMSEIQQLNGALCYTGRRFALPTPYNSLITTIITFLTRH